MYPHTDKNRNTENGHEGFRQERYITRDDSNSSENDSNSSELLELIPSADWKDPNQVEVRPGSQVRGRPLSHRKQYVSGTMLTNGGKAYPVERGERVQGVHGVGQESIDGFMEKNPKSVWARLPDETKMQVLASFIKSNITNQALWTAAKTVGALGIPTR